mmetsp:Transcript_12387/g.20751  ORF Transcript_12387/g.20751 Transcript_12387/m.20751 type:complete len:272 (-) Transcript_12387:3072-3887(-)
MLGLDICVIDVDTPFKQRQFGTIEFKFGPIEANYLKLEKIGSRSSIFSLFHRTDSLTRTLLDSNRLELLLLSSNFEMIAQGFRDNVKLDVMYKKNEYQTLHSPKFTYLGGCEVEVSLISKHLDGPDIEFGTIVASVTLFGVDTNVCRMHQQSAENESIACPRPPTESEIFEPEEGESSASDASLDRFLHRFNRQSTAQQTQEAQRSHSTQTRVRSVPPRRRPVRRRSIVANDRNSKQQGALSFLAPTRSSQYRADQAVTLNGRSTREPTWR